ncbi:MAG TPA: inner membrane CreD family protein [Chthoniobacterales bacterium]|nr:inner membrane CreD family protein [Chthoniobacterales bacterium]
MADQQVPPPLPKSQPSFGRRQSTIIKLLGVGALVLVLLIPLAMITGVLSDRLMRRNEAVAEITSSWGKEQNVIGPVLGIPFQYKFKTVKETAGPDGKLERREVEETATGNAYFLPQSLKIEGDVQTQTLHRGIYDAAVFRAQVALSGKFSPPDFGALKIDLKDVQWKDAFVTIAVNDLRGTREGLVLDWGGTKRPMLPGSQIPGYTTGATASLGGDKPIANEITFSIPLDFNGSDGVFFAPFGVQNEATLKSNWPDPAFHDWRRTSRRVHISLYHFTAAGLCLAHGCHRALRCPGDCDVCDAQSGLVRARRGIDADRDRRCSRREISPPRRGARSRF